MAGAYTRSGSRAEGLSQDILAHEPGIPWAEAAGMRDRLAHHCVDTSHAIVTARCLLRTTGSVACRWSVLLHRLPALPPDATIRC